MTRIRHIAITSDDPAAAAEFYKKHFGLTELYRQPNDTGDQGVWLSDGYVYFAIIRYGEADVPPVGPNHSSTLRGLHHIGFEVEDQKDTVASLDGDHVPPVGDFKKALVRDVQAGRPMTQHNKTANMKYVGPDWVQFDVRQSGWDQAISAHMPLLKLVPAPKKE